MIEPYFDDDSDQTISKRLRLGVSKVVRIPDKFVVNWFFSRSWMNVGWGTPAVAVGIFLYLILFTGAPPSPQELAFEYRQHASLAIESGDPQAGNLWLRKSELLDPQPATRFHLAMIAADNDDLHRARRLMRQLAPNHTTGHGPAHLWQANDLLDSLREGDADQRELLMHHLKAGLQTQPDNAVAREHLARLEIASGNTNAAIDQYQYLLKADPSRALPLARLLVVQGDSESANEVAASGIDHFRTVLQQNGGDVASRIALSRLEGFLERFNRCAKLLLEGVRRDPAPDSEDMNALRVELGNVYHGRALLLQRTQPERVAERLESLQLALKFTPENPRVLETIAEVVRLNNVNANDAYEIVSHSLAKGTATPMVHLILSMAAFERERFDLEQQHLMLALEADPNLVVAMNNLAWRLATAESPQLDKAFELIDQAVSQAPQRPEFRATRGRIHQLLGQNTNAIIDLEAALGKLKVRPDINDALAELYEANGDDSLAFHHRQRATQIRKN